MIRIPAYYFSEHTVSAGGIMQLNNFINFSQLLHSIFINGSLFKKDSQKRAYVISDLLSVYYQVLPFYNAHVFHLFHPHVDCSAGNDELLGYFRIRDGGIIHQVGENLNIEIVNF